MSKKPVPAKQTKEAARSAGIASHSDRSESAMSNSEITSLVEKATLESLSKHTAQLQLETNQQLHGVSAELKQFSEDFQGLKKDQSQRIENIEKVLSGLQQSYDQLGRQLKKLEIERNAEEKVQLVREIIAMTAVSACACASALEVSKLDSMLDLLSPSILGRSSENVHR